MTVVYATEEPPMQFTKSIFLAGPTPRSQDVPSWRPEALQLLESYGYDGVVFVPEDRPDEHGRTTFHGNYDMQVEWETTYLNMADCILFWIPRNLHTMPAFTTNVEWGVWQKSGKVVLGAPRWAVKNSYLIHQALHLGMPVYQTLGTTAIGAINHVGDGALRSGGEREVPLHIWRTRAFREWYKDSLNSGDELRHASVEWVFKIGDKVHLWALKVDVRLMEGDYDVTEILATQSDAPGITMTCPIDALPAQSSE